MNRSRTGFTLIEVMACVLILSMGLTAACGLVLYGLQLVRSAHGKAIGMATAMTVLVDPHPLLTDQLLTPTETSPDGYLNGLWVMRSECDEEPLDGLLPSKLVAVTVKVDVYEAKNGECFASVSRRLIRRKP